jgi:Holliday junction resolvase RusA-like endonuclease
MTPGVGRGEMNVWELRVYGLPVPQGRPRAFVTRSGHASVYDPAASREWKNVVRAQAIAGRPLRPLEGAVDLSLVFYLPRPVSLPRRVHYHTKRPDGDNLGKAIKDALRGLLYRDDSQVVVELTRKLYADRDRQPGVLIVAIPLEETIVMGENVAVAPQEIPF